MAVCTKGYIFGATETVTNAKLHSLVDSATITAIVNADIDAGAAIAFSKLAQENIDASKLIGMENITDDGVIPIANIPKKDEDDMASDSASFVPTQQSTKAYVDTLLAAKVSDTAYAASWDNVTTVAPSKNALYDKIATMPTYAPTQVNDTDTGTTFDNDPVVTFLTKDKTITSGNTVLVMASGYARQSTEEAYSTITFLLKQGATTIQTQIVVSSTEGTSGGKSCPFSMCAIVTGLSGSITFSVTAQITAGDNTAITAYGNLIVYEF